MVRPLNLLGGVCLGLALATGSSAQAQVISSGIEEARPAPGPQLRVVSEDASSMTVEVTAEWETSLADALASSGADLEQLVLTAAEGREAVSHLVEVGAMAAPQVEILSVDAVDVPLSAEAALELADLDRPLVEVAGVGEQRKRIVGSLTVRTLRVQDGRLQRIRRVVARVTRPAVQARVASRGDDNPHLAVQRSVLADGTWFKIPISEEGVYRIDAAYLQDSLGIASPDLARVAVYGNGGRILPALNSDPRPADLNPVPSLLVGDALYVFAEAPSWWDWDGGEWAHDISPFSTETAYFLRVDAEAAARVQSSAFPGWGDAVRQATIEGRRFHEVDRTNYERDQSGSGLDWLGETLTRSARTFMAEPVPAGFVAGQTVQYRTRVAARSNPAPTLTIRANGQVVSALAMRSVSLSGQNAGDLIRDRVDAFTRDGAQDLALSYSYSGGNADALVWLDWIEAIYDVDPTAEGGLFRFPTPGGVSGRLEFALAGFSSQPVVLDVTNPASIRQLGVQAEGGRYLVQIDVMDGEAPRELVAFDPTGASIRQPAAGAVVVNQNVHGLTGTPDYVVVSHPDFLSVAEQLAERRRQRDGLTPLVVTTEQIFNEFASGVGDMRAVRDFMKFLYDRAPDGQEPGYLLLFGDGHYDFRNIKSDVPNYVPVYESENMFNRNLSFMSDDYFGLLGDDEGVWPFESNSSISGGRVDLAIGRIPARTIEDAATVLEKIEQYEDPSNRGEWRSRFTFIGDDQFPNSFDRDLHVQNADATAEVAQAMEPSATFQKIYAPSFPLDRGARGDRRPLVNDAIRQAINEGTLIWNYSGHGGPDGLGDEKYVTEDLLNSLDNGARLPIFVTATCSFGKFDITNEQSLAEQFLLAQDKGGVAMLTTVRIVYTSSSESSLNLGLNIELTEQLLTREADGRPVRLGDALFRTKNTTVGRQHNNRKFNLLGDPAMRIGLPERRVSVEAPAELKAFEEATVSGTVRQLDGSLDAGYTGEVTITVFDAARTVDLPDDIRCCTLSDTNGNQRPDYQIQTDRIFSGRAAVTAGRFTATFLVPQDISYSGETARVAAYVNGQSTVGSVDGFGQSVDAIVSPVAGTRPNDNEGPAVRLFLNDTTFVAGSAVAPGATLIATLRDPSGINTVGAGVGHTLLLTIDGDAANAIDVGSAYVGDVGTYQSGQIRFPLPELAPGPHTLTLTAWDAVNNASTAELAFVMEEGEALAVRSVLPYPNPTAGPTRFVFEHNRVGSPARVQLRIYTLAGRPIRTIGPDEALPGGLLTSSSVQIPWDGLDDDQDRLASGVYLFRLRLEIPGEDGGTEVAERVDRLAIIR
ncbi:MAG: type IX secretion system sortase PorU [Rubricoccaceae bacterium]